jgi:thymidylate synthase (FAD)
MHIVEPSVELVWITPEALRVIEAAGRTCYKSEDKIADGTAEAFVRQILARGHESVVEHASASFRIVTDRGISHEIVRHRLASYSQESTRYCNYGKDRFGAEIALIQPPGMNEAATAAWRNACEAAEAAYFRMIEAGAAPQIARAVLPTCLKTELVMTATFREWRHFLKLRSAPAAHPQIVEIARMIHQILRDKCPAVFGDL